MAACYGGYLAVAQRLIAAGAHTEPIDRLHRSAMVHAAGQGHGELVTLLLDNGVAVDAPMSMNSPP